MSTAQTSPQESSASTVSGAAETDDSDLLTAYADALAGCLDGPPEQVGERLIRTFLRTWEDPQLGPRFAEYFRSSFTSEAGEARLRDFMSTRLAARVAEKIKTQSPDIGHTAGLLKIPPLNVNAAPAQVWGVVLMRYILKIEPIASASQEEIVALIAPTIQRYLGGYSVPATTPAV